MSSLAVQVWWPSPKAFSKASVDEQMFCCVQLRYSFFAPLHSDAGPKPALNPPKNTSTPPAPAIFPYFVWMVLQSSVRASSRLLASMAKYSSRSTSPGYFIALKRKLPAGRVCLPKMAALCTTERRALSKSGRKRSSNKARSLQREHVCLHPTFMQSAESMPSKSSFSFGTAFNWKKEAGSASHPGLKPKISFSSKCFTFWATSSYFSSLPPWTTIRNTLLELLHKLTGNTDIDTEHVPAWNCPRFRKTWGGPGFHVLSDSFLIWQLYIFCANAGKKFGDKRPPTSRYKTLPASLKTSSALCATGKQLGRTNSSWTSRLNIRCFSSKICRISSCWLSSGNSLRLQARIPPAQHTLHNSPCSKVKLKEENKWTQTLQHAKLAGKMKRHQVTATGSN